MQCVFSTVETHRIFPVFFAWVVHGIDQLCRVSFTDTAKHARETVHNEEKTVSYWILLPSWDRTPSRGRKYCSPSDVYLSRRDIGSVMSPTLLRHLKVVYHPVWVTDDRRQTPTNISHDTCSKIQETIGINIQLTVQVKSLWADCCWIQMREINIYSEFFVNCT